MAIEEIMGERMTEEKFYELMSQRLEEIYSLPISLKEKRNLHYLTYETMHRYIEGNKCHQENEKNWIRLGEGLKKLETSLYQIKDNLEKIQESGKIALINAQIASAKMKDSIRKINKINQNGEETTKGLVAKLDAKNTLLDVTLKMINQNRKN